MAALLMRQRREHCLKVGEPLRRKGLVRTICSTSRNSISVQHAPIGSQTAATSGGGAARFTASAALPWEDLLVEGPARFVGPTQDQVGRLVRDETKLRKDRPVLVEKLAKFGLFLGLHPVAAEGIGVAEECFVELMGNT